MLSLLFVIMLVICSVFDIKSREIPIIMPIVLSLVAFMFTVQNNVLIKNLKASLVIFVILVFISLISRQALGLGDVAVLSACTLFSGIISVALIISVSMMLSTIITLIIMAYKRFFKNNSDKRISIPLMPYITVGFVFTLI